MSNYKAVSLWFLINEAPYGKGTGGIGVRDRVCGNLLWEEAIGRKRARESWKQSNDVRAIEELQSATSIRVRGNI